MGADPADRAAMDAALRGAYGVFSVQPADVGVPVEPTKPPCARSYP
jgi:hypothetical protein